MGCGRSKAYHVAKDFGQQPDIESAQQPSNEPPRPQESQPVASVQELSEVVRVRRLRALPPVPGSIPPFPIVPAFSQDTNRESLRLSTFSEPPERNKLYSPRPSSPSRRSSLGPPPSLSVGLPSRSAKLAKLFGPPRGDEPPQLAGSSQSHLPHGFRRFQQPGQSPPIPQLRARRTSREAKPSSPAAQLKEGNRALATSSGCLESNTSPPPPPPLSSLWPFSQASPGSKSLTPPSRQPRSSTSVSPGSKGKQASQTK
jgi:hypothetical protein